MKRLYYLTDNIDKAESISNDLHRSGISDWNFHVVSQDEAGLYRHHLHGTSFLGKTDLIHTAERGALLGVAAGVIAALILSMFITTNLLIDALVILFFACFGAWLGGLIGLGMTNYRLVKFEGPLSEGHYLLMIDVSKDNHDEVERIMLAHRMNAIKAGEGSSFNNPFQTAQSYMGSYQ